MVIRRKLDKSIMSEEEFSELVSDLCARLPKGVVVKVTGDWFYDEREPYDTELKVGKSNLLNAFVAQNYGERKLILTPYLRPMSSMTDEERDEIVKFTREPQKEEWTFAHRAYDYLDWLVARHFDYRGLIEKGLALPAKKGMYK